MFFLTGNPTEITVFHLIARYFRQAPNRGTVGCASKASARNIRTIHTYVHKRYYLTVLTANIGNPLEVLNAGANIVPSSSARVRNMSSWVIA